MPLEPLHIVVLLKAVTEIAGFALIGQGVLYVLAGRNREQNFAYRILKTVTSPVFALARLIAPRFFVQEYLWALAPAIVLVLWVLFTYLKIRLVLMAA